VEAILKLKVSRLERITGKAREAFLGCTDDCHQTPDPNVGLTPTTAGGGQVTAFTGYGVRRTSRFAWQFHTTGCKQRS
jgi:hypothetical protein